MSSVRVRWLAPVLGVVAACHLAGGYGDYDFAEPGAGEGGAGEGGAGGDGGGGAGGGACVTAEDCEPSTTCRAQECDDGQCLSVDAPNGTLCSDDGGAICDGSGSCVPTPGPGDPVWSHRFGGTQIDRAYGVAVDEEGHVYVVGSAGSDPIDFGGGPLEGFGKTDVFVAKLDAHGTHLWSKRFGGPDDDRATTVAVAGSRVFVAGELLSGSVDFGKGPLINASSAGGQPDIFVLCMHADQGEVSWSAGYGTAFEDRAHAIAADADGNVAVTGSFAGGSIMYGGEGISNRGDAGTRDAFVASFDATGNRRFSRGYGGERDDEGRSVAFDAAGNLWLGGGFASGSIELGGSAPHANAQPETSGTSDAFVLRLNGGGVTTWAMTFGGDGDDVASAVAAAADGGVVVAGAFTSSFFTFGEETFDGPGGGDLFVAKVTASSQTVEWGLAFGGEGADELGGLTIDASGNVLLCGATRSTQLQLGPESLDASSDVAGEEAFAAKLDGDGQHVWSRLWGAAGDEGAAAIAVDPVQGRVAIAGEVTSPSLSVGGKQLAGNATDVLVLSLAP